MNYGELRDLFKDYLNRDDCDDIQADGFIIQGLRRVERQLRTPLQKGLLTVTVDDTFNSEVVIPSDFLGTLSVSVNGKPVRRVTEIQAQEFDGYILDLDAFKFTYPLNEGDVIDIKYYTAFPEATSDIDITTWTYVIDDLVLFSGLVYAGIFFVDSRKSEWESFSVSLLQEVQLQSDVEAMSGDLAITPYGGGIV